MHSSPVRHSPPVRASSYCAAVRLACVRPTASVHSEPGSNSSLKTTCPKANALSCRSQTWQRIACLLQLIHCLIKTSARWTVILPAGVLTRYLRILSKNLGIGLSAFFRRARRFRRSEPPIIAGFSASSTPFFKAVPPKWTLLPMPLLRRP